MLIDNEDIFIHSPFPDTFDVFALLRKIPIVEIPFVIGSSAHQTDLCLPTSMVSYGIRDEDANSYDNLQPLQSSRIRTFPATFPVEM